MSYTAGQTPLWPLTPNWSDAVIESLEWLTDVLRAQNGRAQKRGLRRSPRRGLEFSVLADDQNRRVLDNLLQANGSGYWLLPVWHDVQLLTSGVVIGSTTITCLTTGFDFVEGGKAVLRTSLTDWEVVTIDTVDTAGLTLSAATLQAFDAGVALYPLRLAMLNSQPEETTWSDRMGTRPISFRIAEPCDWIAVLPASIYRGYPILDRRPDWSQTPKNTFERDLDIVDSETGPITVFDWPGRSFRQISMRWIAYGRAENAALRSLIYALRGRQQTVWVPSWQSDLRLVNTVSAIATSLTIEWSGYSLFGVQAHWRDIRIELTDGAAFYRRITAVDTEDDREILDIDTALGVTVTPAQVRCISFMVLAEQVSDTVELRHPVDADGITELSIAFKGIRHDI